MIVYIIRHAWAGKAGDLDYPDDRQRPLTPEGKTRFTGVVKTLVGRGFQPSLIATSPLVRCRQTAQVVAEHVPGSPRVCEIEALSPGSDFGALATWTAGQGERDLAWVGHAPDVGNLAAALIGEGTSWIRFPKGAIAAVRFDEGFHRARGELLWLATAKILGC